MHILPSTNSIYNMDVNALDVFTALQTAEEGGGGVHLAAEAGAIRHLEQDNVAKLESRVPAAPPATIDCDILFYFLTLQQETIITFAIQS